MSDDKYPDVPGHVAGVDTSEQAARSMDEDAGTLRARVFDEIKRLNRGVTCDELEHRLGMSHQTTSARVRELVLKGKIIDSGNRAKTRSGRSARLYVVAGDPQGDLLRGIG